MAETQGEIQEVVINPSQEEKKEITESPTIDILTQIGRALANLPVESPRLKFFFERFSKSSLDGMGIKLQNMENADINAFFEVIKTPARTKAEKEARAVQLRQTLAAFPQHDIILNNKSIDGKQFAEQVERFFTLDAEITEEGGLLSILGLNSEIERLIGSTGFEHFAKGNNLSEEVIHVLKKLQLLYGVSESNSYDRQKALFFTQNELLVLRATLAAMKEKLSDIQSAEKWFDALKASEHDPNYKYNLIDRLYFTKIYGSSMNALVNGLTNEQAQYDAELKKLKRRFNSLSMPAVNATPQTRQNDENERQELISQIKIKEDMIQARDLLDVGYIHVNVDIKSIIDMRQAGALKFPFVAGIIMKPATENGSVRQTIKVVTDIDPITGLCTCLYCDNDTATRLTEGQELSVAHYGLSSQGLLEEHLITGTADKYNKFQIEIEAISAMQAPVIRPRYDSEHTEGNPWHETNEVTEKMGWGALPFDGFIQQLTNPSQISHPKKEQEEAAAASVA